MTESTTGFVFIVDDDQAVRSGIARLLKSVHLTVIAFASAADFLRYEAVDHPCCLVLDVRMPGLSGLELQEQLRERGLEIPIVFITGHASVPVSVRAMKGGAVDFLEKPFDEQSLLEAIQGAIARSRAIQSRQAAARDAAQRVARLTPREREVFDLVAAGLLNKQIADRLALSEKTVKVHRGRVMRKLSVSSVAELVHLAEKTAAPVAP